MSSSKLNERLQLATSVGVIIGLILVAFELRQNQELTRAQLNSDSLTGIETFVRSRQQEPLARAIAKAKESPLELTGSERVMLDGYYKEALQAIVRERLFIEKGIYSDTLDSQIALFARDALETAYGQVWWDNYKKGISDSDYVARVDAVAAGRLDRMGVEVNEELKQLLREKFGF